MDHLGIVTALVRSTFNPQKLAFMVLETVGFAVFMVWIVRPLLKKWTAYHLSRHSGKLSAGGLAITLIIVFLAAALTNLIGIFSIFGAFFLGALLYDQREFREAIQHRLRDFVTVFFVPIFFTYTGLRTDIGTMAGASLWVMCGLVLLTAFVGKFGGCSLAARLNGLPWREASMIGVMMNTRALMELIVINIGFELGIIPKSVFFMLVFMAVVTTYVTTPVLRRLVRSSELERDGAGPAGLQLGYFLEQAGHDYLILEAGSGPGSFFRSFPRHRRLISINKAHTGWTDSELNLRVDWNSLLSDDPGLRFTNYSERYFPDAEDLVRYPSDFAAAHQLRVQYNTRVVEITRNGNFCVTDQHRFIYEAHRLIVATGVSRPFPRYFRHRNGRRVRLDVRES
jgi:hypothetical protein